MNRKSFKRLVDEHMNKELNKYLVDMPVSVSEVADLIYKDLLVNVNDTRKVDKAGGYRLIYSSIFEWVDKSEGSYFLIHLADDDGESIEGRIPVRDVSADNLYITNDTSKKEGEKYKRAYNYYVDRDPYIEINGVCYILDDLPSNHEVAVKGKSAGYYHKNGYRHVEIDGICYRSDHLAWFYMTKEWPDDIEHINGIKDDDSFANLRPIKRTP